MLQLPVIPTTVKRMMMAYYETHSSKYYGIAPNHAAAVPLPHQIWMPWCDVGKACHGTDQL